MKKITVAVSDVTADSGFDPAHNPALDIKDEPFSLEESDEALVDGSPGWYEDKSDDYLTIGGPKCITDKGRYSYSKVYCYYQDEYRKIRTDCRKDYAYFFADNTYAIVKPGDYAASDGRVVTEEDIHCLHMCRDNEVARNCKIKFRKPVDTGLFDFYERLDQEEMKMFKGLDNEYEEMKALSYELRTGVSIDSFVDEEGNDCTDHMMEFADPAAEIRIDLIDSPLLDEVEKVMETMTERERAIFSLVRLDGMTITDASKKLGLKQSTAAYHLKKADQKIRNNSFIARQFEIGHYWYERLEAWDKEQREKKKHYEESHKRHCAEKAAIMKRNRKKAVKSCESV